MVHKCRGDILGEVHWHSVANHRVHVRLAALKSEVLGKRLDIAAFLRSKHTYLADRGGILGVPSVTRRNGPIHSSDSHGRLIDTEHASTAVVGGHTEVVVNAK